jgi:hypothetical protein
VQFEADRVTGELGEARRTLAPRLAPVLG